MTRQGLEGDVTVRDVFTVVGELVDAVADMCAQHVQSHQGQLAVTAVSDLHQLSDDACPELSHPLGIVVALLLPAGHAAALTGSVVIDALHVMPVGGQLTTDRAAVKVLVSVVLRSGVDDLDGHGVSSVVMVMLVSVLTDGSELGLVLHVLHVLHALCLYEFSMHGRPTVPDMSSLFRDAPLKHD